MSEQHPPARATGPFRLDWGAALIVSLVTVMIWLFAESESLVRGQHSARVRFVDAAAERVVQPTTPGWDQTIRVTVEGATAAVQRAPSLFANGFTLTLGQPGVPEGEGEQPVDLLAALRAERSLAEAGLTIVDVEPPTIAIRVEALVELADVEVEADVRGVEPAEPPVIEPSRVVVRAPARLIDELKALSGGARVTARPPGGAVESLTAGARHTVDARLALPDSLAAGARDAQISPPSVRMTLTIKGRKESIEVASAPVQVLLPPHELDSWRVEINPDDRLIKDLTITGPTELVAQVRDGRIPVVAVLALSSDELQARIPAKPVDFWRLPPGLTVAGGDGPIRLVIEPRTQPPPMGPAPPQ